MPNQTVQPESTDILQTLNEAGFLGPFDALVPDAKIDRCRDLCESIVAERRRHPLYDRYAARDWHLVHEDLLDFVTRPELISHLVELLGPDLTLWRTKIFHKKPGEGELGWHQEVGLFAGDEIGNNSPSLWPSHAPPTPPDWSSSKRWNLTIWVSLDDIPSTRGPLQFICGSHHKQFPVDMVPIPESAFFHDPFIGVNDPRRIIDLTKRGELILDIDTRRYFDGVDPSSWSIGQLRSYLLAKLSELRGEVVLPFTADPAQLVTLEVKKGQFIIFDQRTMHNSLPNQTTQSRIAVSYRVTSSDTLVYPSRLKHQFIDSSNLDISRHRSILLHGHDRNGNNAY